MSEAIPGRVWVTGAGGLIGHACVEVARASGFSDRVRPLVRAEIDLTEFQAVERLFAHERPSGVIHCAARSRSPACQADPAGARLQNVEVTRRLAADALIAMARPKTPEIKNLSMMLHGDRGQFLNCFCKRDAAGLGTADFSISRFTALANDALRALAEG